MSTCSYVNWTFSDLAQALEEEHRGDVKIAVPMFQRGKRWKKDQQLAFIDSIKQGYPVGTMLFYERHEENRVTNILVDGLQRANCIKSYINNPTEYLTFDNIEDETCDKFLTALSIPITEENKNYIRNEILDFIKKPENLNNPQFYSVVTSIALHFSEYCSANTMTQTLSAITIINDFYRNFSDTHNKIKQSVIPVVIYSGEESKLPIIFDRINSQGTPLTQYEVYAASWPVDIRQKIDSIDIVDFVSNKYKILKDDGFIIDGYNEGEFRQKSELNMFEFMFGLSKYLVNKYSILSFNTNQKEDETNPLAFELVDACFNDTNRISNLYKILKTIDLNRFQQALENAIVFVKDAINDIVSFKGNKRVEGKILHPKFLILSMIATVFRTMYEGKNYNHFSTEWNTKKQLLKSNLRSYYIFDIINNTWSEGGTTKIYKYQKESRFFNLIPYSTWNGALNHFYDLSMQRQEKTKIMNPGNEEIVILNVLYLKVFSAQEQLSSDYKFDIEHIATKAKMKRFLKNCDGYLPISSIANLCYLPERLNRSKHEFDFYEQTYSDPNELKEIEDKYSFTTEADMVWTKSSYDTPDDYNKLKTNYIQFCNKRFEIIKKKFFKELNIEVPTE